MTLSELLAARRSIRQFEKTPVPPELVEKIISRALQVPSSSNTQSYRLALASGALCEQLRTELTRKYQDAQRINKLPLPLKLIQGALSGVKPDGPFHHDIRYPPELQQRRVDCGMGLYKTLGIERTDREGRSRQMQRNFEFFDAPVVMFLFVNRSMGAYSALDAGIFLQTLMLVASDEGLGTCAQAALGIWTKPVLRHFEIEPDYQLICGLSLGYIADHPVNGFRPQKRMLSEVLCPAKTGKPE
jgi:nitroreductase